MKFHWIKFGIVLWQIVMILLVQSVFSMTRLVVTVTPHKPLDDCATHHCGCNPDKQKRQTCCCHPTPGKEEQDANPWQRVIRAAGCEGATQSPLSLPGHFEFLTARSPEVSPVLFFTIPERPENQIRDAHPVEPPDPPPRYSLSA